MTAGNTKLYTKVYRANEDQEVYANVNKLVNWSTTTQLLISVKKWPIISGVHPMGGMTHVASLKFLGGNKKSVCSTEQQKCDDAY
jgi:hypothetical protein